MRHSVSATAVGVSTDETVATRERGQRLCRRPPRQPGHARRRRPRSRRYLRQLFRDRHRYCRRGRPPIADPLIGLAITVVILKITWGLLGHFARPSPPLVITTSFLILVGAAEPVGQSLQAPPRAQRFSRRPVSSAALIPMNAPASTSAG